MEFDKMNESSKESYEDSGDIREIIDTYFDGKYRRYKKDVEYISLNMKENYATDKTGKVLN